MRTLVNSEDLSLWVSWDCGTAQAAAYRMNEYWMELVEMGPFSSQWELKIPDRMDDPYDYYDHRDDDDWKGRMGPMGASWKVAPK